MLLPVGIMDLCHMFIFSVTFALWPLYREQFKPYKRYSVIFLSSLFMPTHRPFPICPCSKLSWWPLWTWPRTSWAVTTWTFCSLWVSLVLALMEAKMLPALVTSSPCSGKAVSKHYSLGTFVYDIFFYAVFITDCNILPRFSFLSNPFINSKVSNNF